MAFNDAFGLWGHWAFSSRKTHGRAIYESLRDGQGEAYSTDFNSLEQGKLFARAVTLATAQYQLDRALNNRSPEKATDLLGKLEEDFQVTPGPNDTLKQRRDFLASIFAVARGNSAPEINQALSILLGSDFVSFVPGPVTLTFPSAPGSVGVFSVPGTEPKQFSISSAISTTGTPIAVGYSLLSESNGPVVGELYTVDPDTRRSIEQISILAVTPTTITAQFSRAHEAGVVAVRPYNIWLSTRRLSHVIVTLQAAQNVEIRRKINELMARAMRGVSQWSIVSDQGKLKLDQSGRNILDATKLG